MPFTTLDKIRPMVHPIVAIALVKTLSGDTVFNHLESEAAILIRDMTGIAIPADTDDTPDWLHLPAAYIIQQLAAPHISELTDATRAAIEKAYLNAISILDRHPQPDPTSGEDLPLDKSSSFILPLNHLEAW